MVAPGAAPTPRSARGELVQRQAPTGELEARPGIGSTEAKRRVACLRPAAPFEDGCAPIGPNSCRGARHTSAAWCSGYSIADVSATNPPNESPSTTGRSYPARRSARMSAPQVPGSIRREWSRRYNVAAQVEVDELGTCCKSCEVGLEHRVVGAGAAVDQHDGVRLRHFGSVCNQSGPSTSNQIPHPSGRATRTTTHGIAGPIKWKDLPPARLQNRAPGGNEGSETSGSKRRSRGPMTGEHWVRARSAAGVALGAAQPDGPTMRARDRRAPCPCPAPRANVRDALFAVMERHEALRTTFERPVGLADPVQIVHDRLEPTFTATEVDDDNALDMLIDADATPLDHANRALVARLSSPNEPATTRCSCSPRSSAIADAALAPRRRERGGRHPRRRRAVRRSAPVRRLCRCGKRQQIEEPGSAGVRVLVAISGSRAPPNRGCPASRAPRPDLQRRSEGRSAASGEEDLASYAHAVGVGDDDVYLAAWAGFAARMVGAEELVIGVEPTGAANDELGRGGRSVRQGRSDRRSASIPRAGSPSSSREPCGVAPTRCVMPSWSPPPPVGLRADVDWSRSPGKPWARSVESCEREGGTSAAVPGEARRRSVRSRSVGRRRGRRRGPRRTARHSQRSWPPWSTNPDRPARRPPARR